MIDLIWNNIFPSGFFLRLRPNTYVRKDIISLLRLARYCAY